MLLHTQRRARNRRGMAAGEWIALIVVFVLGTGIGLWATGGFDSPQARASLIDFAQRSGLNLEPYLGTITNPVGTDLRQVVGATEHGDNASASVEPTATNGPPVDAASLRRLVAAANEEAPHEDSAQPTKKTKKSSKKKSTATGARTLAYWNGLNSIMSEEFGMRRTPGKLTADNANGFVDSLASANNFAAKSIRELDTKNVDAEVLALGDEIAGWYEEGAALNGEATYLLNEADPNQRRGAEGKAWEKNEKTHQKRCEEINRRGDALRGKMSKKYALDFPDLK